MIKIRYVFLAIVAFAVVGLSSCNFGNQAANNSPTPNINSETPVLETAKNEEARDIDYMTKLGLMKGHMIVGKELLDLNKPKQAEPHIGHPVEEIYADIEEDLEKRQVKEFKTGLDDLHNLVKLKPSDPEIATNFASSMKAIDDAIAVLPEDKRKNPAFILQTINGLLDTANSEYGAAIAKDKIVEDIEYQDSRGFVLYAQELYDGIAEQMTKNNPQANKEIKTAMTDLIKAWPTAIAPEKPVKSPDEVNKLVKNIEQNVQSIISS
ncbi:hypothetical protein [Mastigocoleus sp. MO_188.B34]|uniref:hypothetical protein n=1 Tax=Mastigocoleus sp. MO_188.B34 TaxID=3036635 RepID=UPI00260B236E|nr:hypothetical protein [Mastigocoleus sp. MO_188.B34]MDJ0693841.1 hypothetical protein [Mastigocoleus sp. MO_188.B34]